MDCDSDTSSHSSIHAEFPESFQVSGKESLHHHLHHPPKHLKPTLNFISCDFSVHSSLKFIATAVFSYRYSCLLFYTLVDAVGTPERQIWHPDICFSCFMEESSETAPGSGVTHGALGLVATSAVTIRVYCSQPDVKQRLIKCEMGEQRQSHGAGSS